MGQNHIGMEAQTLVPNSYLFTHANFQSAGFPLL